MWFPSRKRQKPSRDIVQGWVETRSNTAVDPLTHPNRPYSAYTSYLWLRSDPRADHHGLIGEMRANQFSSDSAETVGRMELTHWFNTFLVGRKTCRVSASDKISVYGSLSRNSARFWTQHDCDPVDARLFRRVQIAEDSSLVLIGQ